MEPIVVIFLLTSQLLPIALVIFIKSAQNNRFGIKVDSLDFGSSISICFKKYFDFKGRATRSEFWYFALFYSIVYFLISIGTISIPELHIISFLFFLLTFFPYIAVTTRRLHDRNRSGWWQLMVLLPFVGSIILLVWYCSASVDDLTGDI